jgi:hypothetical protein
VASDDDDDDDDDCVETVVVCEVEGVAVVKLLAELCARAFCDNRNKPEVDSLRACHFMMPVPDCPLARK